MNKRTFKRIQMLHHDGVGLRQSIAMIISLSNSDDEAAESIIKLVYKHLIEPPRIKYATDAGLNLVDLQYFLDHAKEVLYDNSS